MHPQKEALVRLLADDDESTVHLVKVQLAQVGSEQLADLRDLANCDNPAAALHARDVLHAVIQNEAVTQFEALCATFDEQSDLEEACWLLSTSLLRGLDTVSCCQRLDIWGAELERRLRRSSHEKSHVEIMTDFLANELTFTGNTEDYYHEENSLLPCVLDSRKGVPITLVLLYMFIGRRAGISIGGVNLPGHFLARHGAVLFDPFHGGRVMTQRDCAEILRRQNKQLEAWHLHVATQRQILTRTLANLLYAYHRCGNQVLYQRLKRWSHILCGNT